MCLCVCVHKHADGAGVTVRGSLHKCGCTADPWGAAMGCVSWHGCMCTGCSSCAEPLLEECPPALSMHRHGYPHVPDTGCRCDVDEYALVCTWGCMCARCACPLCTQGQCGDRSGGSLGDVEMLGGGTQRIPNKTGLHLGYVPASLVPMGGTGLRALSVHSC